MADSVRQIGFFVDHHFVATSHFKGCHDGLGGFAKNAMRRRERFCHRSMGPDGVVSVLKNFFRERVGGEGEEGMRKYFTTWSLYRIRKAHVELIGKKEIYRPNSILEGIYGTREMYHFAGANTPKYGAQTTTKGLEDIELVLKRKGEGRLTEEEESRLARLGEVKVKHTGKWTRDEAGEPVSGEEVVDVRKSKRTYSIRTCLVSCFCSACQRSQYEDGHVNRAYPGIVPALRDGQVRETAIMYTGVAPVDGSEGEEITFKSREKTCQMARATGTQSQDSDLEAASKLWEELGRAVSDNGLVFKCVLLLVFVAGSCDGRKRVFQGRNRGGEGEWSVNIVGFVFCDDAVIGNAYISTITNK